MASGDIYQLVDEQDFLGMKVLNVYFYRQSAAVLVGDVPQQLADSFEATVLPDITPLQADDVVHRTLIVTNLFNPSEVATSPISVAGSSGDSDSSAPFNAIGFRLRTDNGAVRNGAKRIGGLIDGHQEDGVLGGGALIADLIAAGVAMALGLDAGIVASAFVPVVVKRILDGGDYRLPETAGEAVYGNIIEALYNANITSQTTRKFGRGV